MQRTTLRLIYAGVLLALSILLPMVFHLFLGGIVSGTMFLPMHIPVLLAGFLLGPWYGLVIGMVAPIMGSFLMAMPSMARMPFMVVELGTYGFCVGVLYYFFKNKKFGIYITLISGMIIGRVVYGSLLYIFIDLLHLPLKNTVGIIAATITGIYGIIIQLVFIPLILVILKKGGLLNGLYESSKKNINI